MVNLPLMFHYRKKYVSTMIRHFLTYPTISSVQNLTQNRQLPLRGRYGSCTEIWVSKITILVRGELLLTVV